jgi:hypothetical protein
MTIKSSSIVRLKSVTEANGWLVFLLFCLVIWLFAFINDEFVVTEELYNQYIQSQMNEKYEDYEAIASEFEDDITQSLDDSQFDWKENLFDFSIIVIQNIIQLSLISAFLFVALTILQYTDYISFGQLFKIVLISEFIFFIPKTIKYVWFIIHSNSYSLEDVKTFSPFSLYGITKSYIIADWLAYPLRFINIFELIYIVTVTTLISSMLRVKFKAIIFPVTISYLTLMLLWITFRIYLSVIV